MEEIEDEEVSDAFSEDCADQRDGFSKVRADQRDGFSKTRADQSHGSSKIRADQCDGDGCSSGRRMGDQSESEKGSDVGGVWIVGNVEEIEDEEVSDAFSEDCADQRGGFSNTRADQGDEFGFFRGEGRANVRRKRARRNARTDETGSSH